MAENQNPTCADCKKPMDPGFIPDLQGFAYVQNIWHPAPCDKTGKGLQIGLWKEHINVDRKKGIEIVAFRCGGCGSIKLFAPNPT